VLIELFSRRVITEALYDRISIENRRFRWIRSNRASFLSKIPGRRSSPSFTILLTRKLRWMFFHVV